jgi:hypothetical protein
MIVFASIIVGLFSSKPTANEKDLKILVLIIASDTIRGSEVFEPYLKMQDMWRSYMHLDPAHVEAYLIKANPDLSAPYEIEGDVIWSKTQESWVPGILVKTLYSMESLLPRLKEFDYVIRPNLSSFYVFPRLLEFLKTAPREKCYCGPRLCDRFLSGAGFILSRDMAEMLVENKEEILRSPDPDDVAIGDFLRSRGIPMLGVDWRIFNNLNVWNQEKDQIPSSIFHFRTKNDDESLRGTDELFIQSELFKMFYGKAENL